MHTYAFTHAYENLLTFSPCPQHMQTYVCGATHNQILKAIHALIDIDTSKLSWIHKFTQTWRLILLELRRWHPQCFDVRMPQHWKLAWKGVYWEILMSVWSEEKIERKKKLKFIIIRLKDVVEMGDLVHWEWAIEVKRDRSNMRVIRPFFYIFRKCHLICEHKIYTQFYDASILFCLWNCAMNYTIFPFLCLHYTRLPLQGWLFCRTSGGCALQQSCQSPWAEREGMNHKLTGVFLDVAGGVREPVFGAFVVS